MHIHNARIALDIDNTLAPYLNVDISLALIEPYLEFLQQQLDAATYRIYTTQQQRRDGPHHHLTAITPLEYPKLPLERIQPYLAYPLQVDLLGVGHVAEGSNEVYFIVCESREVQAIRASLGLPAADLHITLGFKQHDIFDQAKNRSTLLSPYAEIENQA